jgi:hypothetical protein
MEESSQIRLGRNEIKQVLECSEGLLSVDLDI